MTYSLGFAGRCPPAGWRQAIRPLTSALFDPAIFLDFRKMVVVSHRANEPIYLLMVHLSEVGQKRATRAVMARHRGKKNHKSETSLLKVPLCRENCY